MQRHTSPTAATAGAAPGTGRRARVPDARALAALPGALGAHDGRVAVPSVRRLPS